MTMKKGFTLIETLVAVSLLTVAVVAPMTLTARSLSAAYYARDQITAFHLAQEAVETVRNVRDGNILQNALGASVDLLTGIPSITGQPFTVDTRNGSMTQCPVTCPPLKTDGELYGYQNGSPWVATRFTRTVRAEPVSGNNDEVRVSVTVSWRSGSFQTRTFTISENLYRWIADSSVSGEGGGEVGEAGEVTIILTSGTSWPVPADWNSTNNTIEAIGAGGRGDHNGDTGAGGSGGGAYAKISNLSLTPGASVSYSIGAGTSGTATDNDTWFNGATFAASSVGARGGAGNSGNSGGAGGPASTSIGTVKFDGGDGANRQNSNNGGGGGGAGGGSAAGIDATDGSKTGGAGNGGLSGGGAGATADNQGSAGTNLTGTVGSGGGGGGGGLGQGHGAGEGGLYGGGGGGHGHEGSAGGVGGPGIIVIRYTPVNTGVGASSGDATRTYAAGNLTPGSLISVIVGGGGAGGNGTYDSGATALGRVEITWQ